MSLGDLIGDSMDILSGKVMLDTLLTDDFVLQQNNNLWNSMGDKAFVGGYEYYLGMHIGVCHGPVDAVIGIDFAERSAWTGNVVPVTGSDLGQIVINQSGFWGGRKPGNGGGVVGIVDVLFGRSDQTKNKYLKLHMGNANTPGYRGVLSLVFRGNYVSRFDYYNEFLKEFWTGVHEARKAKLSEPPTHHTGFYWSARQKQLPPPAVVVRRRLQGWYGDTAWQPTLATIGANDMNPAHIIYQCITDRRWGMRRHESFVDADITFLAAAQRLYNEGFGLSLEWNGEDAIENFIGSILSHIDGAVPFNVSTGKYELRLIRSGADKYTLDGNHASGATTVKIDQIIPLDTPTTGNLTIGSITYVYTSYVAATRLFTIVGTLGVAYSDGAQVLVDVVNKSLLMHLTNDDVVVNGGGVFSRPMWGETINEVSLTYTPGITGKSESITKQDLANVTIQGAVIPMTAAMPGIHSRSLAARVCERELRTVSTPTAKLAGRRFTRRAATLVEGVMVRISDADLGLDDVLFHVAKSTQGELDDGSVVLDLVENSFDFTESAFAVVGDTTWVNPLGPPSNVVNSKYISVPYHTLIQRAGNPAQLSLYPNTAYIGVMAEKPSAQNKSITVYADIDATPSGSLELSSGPYCPTALLRASIGKYDTTLQYETPNGVAPSLLANTWFFLDNEKIAVVSVDESMELSGYWTLTVKRAVLDSVPATHTLGAKLWFYNSSAAAIHISRDFSSGDAPYLFVVADGYTEQADVTYAPVLHPTLDAKWNAPYPPANILINGEVEPTDVLVGFTVTWAGRNRITQNSVLVGWTEAHVEPENGVLYTLEVRNGATNALIKTHTDLECGSTGGSFTFYTANSAPYYKISMWATRDGIASEVYTHTAGDMSGFGFNFGNMMGGRTGGIDLDPGGVLGSTSTLYDQTPMAMWLNGKWRHFNFDASADASYGVRTIATDESISRSSVDGGVTWTTDNIDSSANRPQSAVVVLFANTRYVAIGGKYIWHKTDAASTWTRVDTSTLTNNYAGAGDVDSVTHDGTDYVISVNAGKDVYTSAALSAFTRKGTTGSANDITLLMDVIKIVKIGANYIAHGLDASELAVIASSTDLIAWTDQGYALPVLTNPNDWTYFAGEYYAFGTVGSATNGRIGAYKTADGITWTACNLAAPMHSPAFGHPFVTTTKMSMIGGAFVFETTDGTTWTKTRLAFNPILAAFARTRGVLMATEAAPTNILLRTGIRSEDFTKDSTYVGNDRKGKLLSFNSLTDADAALVYPVGATYGEKIGTLGDFSRGVSDAGFDISLTKVDTAGFKGRNSGKRYFEVAITERVGIYSDPLAIEIGVAIAAGAEETFLVSSAMLDGVGRFYQNARIACPGGVIGSDEEPVQKATTMTAGTIIGVKCDFTTKTIYLLANNVVIATLTDVPTTLAYWFPVFSGAAGSLLVNLGQSAFTYSQAGYTAWNA